MKKLLAAGALSQPWVSFSAITQSDDGIIWDIPTQPFQVGDACSSIASDGTTAIIPSNKSNIAISTNLTSFNYQLLPDLFSCKDIAYANGNWIIVGCQYYPDSFNVYPAQSEVAQIYLSVGSAYAWQLIWTNPISYSKFHQVRSFDSAPIASSMDMQPVVIACGFSNKVAEVKYSLDYGESWTSASIPDGIKAIHSVGLFLGGSEPTYFWGCRGKFFKSTSLIDSSTWTEVLVEKNDTIVDIVVNSHNVMVMCGINNIYISYNGENLKKWSYPGYFFNKISFIPAFPHDKWILHARSLLTQYTTWTSTDLNTWTPLNDNVHAVGSTLTV